jgi:DNA-directed RNA polymerase specialized sigma24 family protein
MSGEPWHAILRHLRPRAADEAGGLADEDLVRRWAAGRDEAAFELLLWRHGPMVLAVCRRLLRRAEDAEDAFQATFLVLARKAGAVRRGG